MAKDRSNARKRTLHYIVIMIATLSLWILQGCGFINSQKLVYIIPDNYSGLLVIKFDCPSGKIIDWESRRIEIHFSPDGTFCAATPLQQSEWVGMEAMFADGTPIPVIVDVSQSAFGLIMDMTYWIDPETVRNPTKEQLVFRVAWIGNSTDYASIRNTPVYGDVLHQFLLDRYNVPLP